MASIQERVAKVEGQQAMHEEVCAARWNLLLKVIGWGGGLAFVTVLAVAGFGLREIYNGQQRQMDLLRTMNQQVASRPSDVTVAVTPPPAP